MAELNTDLLIIGGGVTGLCTAYLCRKKNIDCTLIESQETLGKKWRLAGGAMGNMTNRTISPEHYVSHNSKQAKSFCKRFSNHGRRNMFSPLCMKWTWNMKNAISDRFSAKNR